MAPTPTPPAPSSPTFSNAQSASHHIFLPAPATPRKLSMKNASPYTSAYSAPRAQKTAGKFPYSLAEKPFRSQNNPDSRHQYHLLNLAIHRAHVAEIQAELPAFYLTLKHYYYHFNIFSPICATIKGRIPDIQPTDTGSILGA